MFCFHGVSKCSGSIYFKNEPSLLSAASFEKFLAVFDPVRSSAQFRIELLHTHHISHACTLLLTTSKLNLALKKQHVWRVLQKCNLCFVDHGSETGQGFLVFLRQMSAFQHAKKNHCPNNAWEFHSSKLPQRQVTGQTYLVMKHIKS